MSLNYLLFLGSTPLCLKLRPGQQVSMQLHAVKGVGKDYAKFCSVGMFDLASQLFKLSLTFCLAMVSYCLLPHIKISKQQTTSLKCSSLLE